MQWVVQVEVYHVDLRDPLHELIGIENQEAQDVGQCHRPVPATSALEDHVDLVHPSAKFLGQSVT